jgi:hypothetical protein
MANKSLFASLTSRLPRASAVNEAGGRAYKLEPKHALAQVAATGTFGNAFYSAAETQLDEVLKLIDEVDDNGKHAKRKFAGIVLVSDNESWVGAGRRGSTGVMTAWEAFVANQRKLAGKEASPKLVNIDLQPYQTVQACERDDIMNIGGFSDSVFNVISAFLANNNQRFVAEVDAIEL